VIREIVAALSSLAALVALESGTGVALELLKHKWAQHPELLAILPALMDFRGNVALAHSSRATTAQHLGDDRAMVDSTVATMIACLIVPPFIAFAVHEMYGGNLEELAAVAVLTMLAVASVVTPFTVAVVKASVRLGLDPDHVAPALTTSLSDILTVVFTFLIAGVIIS